MSETGHRIFIEQSQGAEEGRDRSTLVAPVPAAPDGTDNQFEPSLPIVDKNGIPTAYFEEWLTAQLLKTRRVEGRINDVDGGGTTLEASVSSTQQALIDLDGRIASAVDVTELTARVANDEQALAAEVLARQEAFVSEELARSTADQALSAEITTVRGDLTAAEGAIAALGGDLTNLELVLTASVQDNASAIVDEQSARASAVQNLQAQINSIDTTGTDGLQAQIDDNRIAIADEEGARAAADLAIQASLNTLDTNVNARIDSTETAIADESSARATSVQSLQAQIDDIEVGDNSGLIARVDTLEQAVVDEGTARAQADLDLQASIENETGQLSSRINQTNTALTNESVTRINQVNSLQVQIDDIDVGSLEASITQTADVVADLEGNLNASLQWTVQGANNLAGVRVFAGPELSNITLSASQITFTNQNGDVLFDANGNLNSVFIPEITARSITADRIAVGTLTTLEMGVNSVGIEELQSGTVRQSFAFSQGSAVDNGQSFSSSTTFSRQVQIPTNNTPVFISLFVRFRNGDSANGFEAKEGDNIIALTSDERTFLVQHAGFWIAQAGQRTIITRFNQDWEFALMTGFFLKA